jgi:hypothetical protein
VATPAIHEVRYLIAEAIDAVAAPVVRERVIERALDLAKLDQVPDHGREIRVFIREHLAHALAESLEADVAEGVIESLHPLMERTSGAEMTGLNQMPDFSAPLPTPQLVGSTLREPESPKLKLATPRRRTEGTLRCVVLFSANAGKREQIERALGDGAPTVHAKNSLAMLDALRDHGADGAVVVIDCVERSVEPWALVALGGQIAPATRLLFWGASADFALELAHLDGRRWRTVCKDASPEQIAKICCALVRGPAPE